MTAAALPRHAFTSPTHDRLVTPEQRATLLAEWFEFCRFADMFGRNYAGYWAYGTRTRRDGWLVCESEVAPPPAVEAQAKRDHRANLELPEGWHVWGKAEWTAAYDLGCRLWGERWYDDPNTDASRYDVVMQLAVLGEVKYG